MKSLKRSDVDSCYGCFVSLSLVLRNPKVLNLLMSKKNYRRGIFRTVCDFKTTGKK